MALLSCSNHLEEKLLEMLVLDGPRDPSHLEQCFLPCDLYSHSSISVKDLIQRSGYCQCCTFSCEVPRYSQTIPVLLKQWAWTRLTHPSTLFPGVLLAPVSVWLRLGAGTQGTLFSQVAMQDWPRFRSLHGYALGPLGPMGDWTGQPVPLGHRTCNLSVALFY